MILLQKKLWTITIAIGLCIPSTGRPQSLPPNEGEILCDRALTKVRIELEDLKVEVQKKDAYSATLEKQRDAANKRAADSQSFLPWYGWAAVGFVGAIALSAVGGAFGAR